MQQKSLCVRCVVVRCRCDVAVAMVAVTVAVLNIIRRLLGRLCARII